MELSIGFINDVHGYLEPHPELFYGKDGEYVRTAGGYARIATVLERIRRKSENALFFDGGDTFHGTLPVVASKGEALIPILNRLGLSAMVGHWDFAYSPEHLLKLAGRLDYPVLGINVYKDDGSLLLKPYSMMEAGGRKVAVIGICSNIIDKTMTAAFREGIHVTDAVQEIGRYIQEVKDLGADLTILLSHNGFPQDIELLKRTPGIDICLSAHTHNRLYEPVSVNDTLVIQCGCHGSFVGHLKLSVESGRITAHDYELIEVTDDIAGDDEVGEMVDGIMSPYRSLQSQVVGQTDIVLHRYSTFSSSMDDLLLAAIKSAAGAEVAFSNGWRYGIPIDKGPVTLWDLYNMVPMNPVISIVELTGREITDMLEENLERTFSPNPMEQMGGYCKRCLGLQVKIHVENAAGYRIEEIYFDGQRLRKERVYRVAFITEQGVSTKYGRNRKDLEVHAVPALIGYLMENPVSGRANPSFY